MIKIKNINAGSNVLNISPHAEKIIVARNVPIEEIVKTYTNCDSTSKLHKNKYSVFTKLFDNYSIQLNIMNTDNIRNLLVSVKKVY